MNKLFLKARMLNNRYLLISLLIVTVQSTNLWFLVGASGLDASYEWLHSYSVVNSAMNNASFIGVFGPLGFLDRSYPDFYGLAALSILWRIISNVVFYFLISGLLRKVIQNSFFVELFSVAVVTFASQIVPASIILSFSALGYSFILYYQKTFISKRILLLYIFTCAFLFLFKLFQFSLAFVALSIVMLMYTRQSRRQNTKLLVPFSALILGFLLTSAFLGFFGFTLDSAKRWIFGYFEISSGYTEMSSEETGRLWEYGAVLFLSIWILTVANKHLKDRVLMLLMVLSIYLAVRYGFNRHDAHSIVTFLYLFILSTIISFVFKRQKYTLVVVSFVILVAVSNVSMMSYLDVFGRLQTNANLTKMLDPRYRADLHVANQASLQQSNPIGQQILDRIKGGRVAVLPWATGINQAWGLGIDAPPVPQLFGAYTSKLDQINTDWLLGDSAPNFILMNKPTSIDGRFPFWDSPKFQASILCNYVPTLSDGSLLLLERSNPKCAVPKISSTSTLKVGRFSVSANDGELILGRLNITESFFEKLLLIGFKRLKPDYITIDGTPYRIVNKTPDNLILAVGPQIQFPGAWNLGQKHTFEIPNGWSMTVSRIKVRQ